MAFTADTGKYGTGFWQGDIADRRLVIDMSKKIHMLNPSDTPFYVLLSQISKESAAQPKFEWMEDELFVTRTFNCDFVVRSDTSTGDTIGFLRLQTPNDMQALEAPPYIAAEDSYDTTETIMTKLTINSSGTDYSYWVILEKAAIANAGVWDDGSTTGVSGGLGALAATLAGAGTFNFADQTPAAAAGDYNATTKEPTGYLIPVIFAVADAGDQVNFTTDEGYHHVTNGSITTNMCVLIDDSTADGTTDTDDTNTIEPDDYTSVNFGTGSADGTAYTCKVQVYTPTMLNGGFYEGSGLPEETRKSVRLLENYTQIAKTPYYITNTAIATSYVGGDELARIRNRHGIQHKIDLEQILLLNGAKAIDATTSESPKRTTQGMGVGLTTKAGFIKTHHPGTATTAYVSGTGGSPYCINYNTDNAFWEDMHYAFERIFDDQISGSGVKNMFVSQKWLGQLSLKASNSGEVHAVTLNANTGDSNMTYGIRVMQYLSPFGTVNFIPAPVLRGYYEDWALIADFKNLTMKVLPGRDTHIVTNAQQPDEDGLKEYYLTEMGLKCMHEQTHGLLRLVTADAS